MTTLRNPLIFVAMALVIAFSVTNCSRQDEAAEADIKPYPLETCVVSGEKLGEMGDPYVFVHDHQQIKLCCKDCLKDFNKDPQQYLAKLKPVESAPVE